MKDEWSLKDKGMRSYPDGKPTGIYSQEVIETLRKKLITEIQMELYSRNGMEFNHGIVEIINRRFGVKK